MNVTLRKENNRVYKCHFLFFELIFLYLRFVETHISNMNLSKPGRARESILHVIWGLKASEPHLMMTMMLSKPLYGFLM